MLSALRKVKSDNKVSMRARLAHARVVGPNAAAVRLVARDLAAAGGLDTDLEVVDGEAFEVTAELA